LFIVLQIPTEIEKLGGEAIRIYREALSEGKEKIPYCNMLILGEGEVGKTSLLRQLIQLPYMKEMERTRGITSEAIKSCLDTSTDNWHVRGESECKEQFAKAVGEIIYDRLPRSDYTSQDPESALRARLEDIRTHLVSPSESSPPNISRLEANVSEPDVVGATPEAQNEDHKISEPPIIEGSDRTVVQTERKKSPEPSVDLDMAGHVLLDARDARNVDSIIAQKKPLEKQVPSLVLTALDFAGHEIYRPMHHCFIFERSLYVMVFKLPDMLAFIRGKVGKKHPKLDDPLVNISFWIHSVHAHTCLKKKRDDMLRRVLLVGTHRDDLENSDLIIIDNFIEERLLQDDDKPYINYIYSASNDSGCSYFVPVENSIDITKEGVYYLEKSGTKLVQDAVHSMTEEMRFLNDLHPIKWLKLEDHLKHYCKAQRSCPIVKESEVRELAALCGIRNQEKQDEALKFFHDTGKITCLSEFHALSYTVWS
jgi:GTPase SAR1 family protein